MSREMEIAWAAKWKAMKKKSFIYLPSDIYSLAYLIHHSSLNDHPESWLKASHWLLLSCLLLIVSSPNKFSWTWAILEESEDEMKQWWWLR